MTRFVAVDLFCGAGGLTHGFWQAGIPVAAGVDIDPTCRFPMETNNPKTHFLEKDVTNLNADEISTLYPKGVVRVLIGCAPCQPFSKYAVRQGQDKRWRLLYDFLRLVRGIRPDVVSMENVPQLMLQDQPTFRDFVSGLEAAGYNIWSKVVSCADYGVPQTRQRLVLLEWSTSKSVIN